MQRIVLLGRGGAGKSTLARRLGERLGIPVVELDAVFWGPALEPLDEAAWVAKQEALTRPDAWILDGDLGPYDALPVRLRRADTVVLLDLPLWRCAVRALRRSRERMDFWRWLATWGWRDRPRILQAIDRHAPEAERFVLRRPRDVDAFLSGVSRV